MIFDKGADTLVNCSTKLITNYLNFDKENNVRPSLKPEHYNSKLPIELGEGNTSISDLGELLVEILKNTPTTTSVKFHNQLFGGRDTASTLGEIAAVIANSPMYTYKVGGPQILIEREVIRKMASMIGYNNADGIFTPGGSLSNMAALIMARNEAVSNIKENGMYAHNRLIVYTSKESHYSISKSAGMVGLGRSNVRYIDVNSKGKMESTKLRKQIQHDIEEGFLPTMINATTGTTVQGAFDPVKEIAGIAKEFGIWLHVDGAYGGSVLLSKKHRYLLEGSNLADSFTWDAHKMMGVPLTCSILLTKKRGMCQKHFEENADYLFQSDLDELNPGKSSLQCGRRNDALKVWATWKHHGDIGLDKRINSLFEKTKYFATKIKNNPNFTLCKEPESLNICFKINTHDAQSVCEYLNNSKKLKVGFGKVDNESIIRMVMSNPDISTQQIDEIISDLIECSKKSKL